MEAQHLLLAVNFWGVVTVTRKAMEVMRGQKTGGVIQQVTSIGGQLGLPVLSICEKLARL